MKKGPRKKRQSQPRKQGDKGKAGELAQGERALIGGMEMEKNPGEFRDGSSETLQGGPVKLLVRGLNLNRQLEMGKGA